MVAGGHAWLWGVCMVVRGVRRIRRDTVNERAVRILLECILFCIVDLVVVANDMILQANWIKF